MNKVEYASRKESIYGPDEIECGDAAVIHQNDESVFVALIDALGHGTKAYEAACLAVDFLDQNYEEPLPELMKKLHIHLQGSRGVVAGLCRIHIKEGYLDYVGVGNISTRIYGEEKQFLVSKDGVVGFSMTEPKEVQAVLRDNDLLILTSDGIRDLFPLEEYPNLLHGSSDNVVQFIMKRFRKFDDASCIVLRYTE